MSDISNKTRALLAEALGIAQEDVSEDTALGMTPQWDSLAHMRLILALEETLGGPLGPDAIVSIMGSADVEALLHAAH